MTARPWRLLFTGKNQGSFNMAADAAVLKEVEEGRSPPTLRIYGWNPWCVSLGYFQDPLRELDPEALRERGWDFVLRPTGGRAVLHAEEITYSLIARCDEEPWCATLAMSYERIAQAWAVALREFDLRLAAGAIRPSTTLRDRELPLRPPQSESTAPCFISTSRSELAYGERKVVGSAQRRTREAFLQHGSIPLTPQHEKLVEVLRLSESMRGEYLEALKRHAISLQEIGALPGEGMDAWSQRLAGALMAALETPCERGEFTHKEGSRLADLEKIHELRQKAFFQGVESNVIPA